MEAISGMVQSASAGMVTASAEQVMEVHVGDAGGERSFMPVLVEIPHGPGAPRWRCHISGDLRSILSSRVRNAPVQQIDTFFLPLLCWRTMLCCGLGARSEAARRLIERGLRQS